MIFGALIPLKASNGLGWFRSYGGYGSENPKFGIDPFNKHVKKAGSKIDLCIGGLLVDATRPIDRSV